MRGSQRSVAKAILAITACFTWLCADLRIGWADEVDVAMEAAWNEPCCGIAPINWDEVSAFWQDPCESPPDPCQPDPIRLGGMQGAPACWYASGEFMALYRLQADVSFQSLPELSNNGAIVLQSSDADDGFAGGLRTVVGRSFGDYRIEGSYFGSYNWSDVAAVRNLDANTPGGNGNMFSPFSDFGDAGGTLGLDYNNYARITFSSTLNNAEINIRRRIFEGARGNPFDGRRLAEASILIGFRYTRIREDFGYYTESDVPAALGATNSVAVHTNNDMYGVQIGWLSQLNLYSRSWIDFDVKGVVYANLAEQRTSYVNVTNGVTSSYSDGEDENVASFAVDLSLMWNYQFAPSWTLRAGYNGIFVMGAALASENFETNPTTLLLGPAELHHSGSVNYHGPSIAVIWTR